MMPLERVSLLGDIVQLGLDVLCRPLGDAGAFAARLQPLLQKLDAEIKTAPGTGQRFLNNFAPLLLVSIERALHKRRFNEGDAAAWDGLVGFLAMQVRVDAGALLAAIKQEGIGR
jgi:hypothetical protein